MWRKVVVFVLKKSYASKRILIINKIKRIRKIYFHLLVSIVANKYISSFFIGTNLNQILNNLHDLVEGFTGNSQTADRLIKKIIKSQIVYNDRSMLHADNIQELINFFKQLESFTENIFEVYDFNCMLNRFLFKRQCKECQKLIHTIIKIHLTRKSHERIDFIFNFILNEAFIKYVFDSDSKFNHATIREIILYLRILIYELPFQI